MRFATISLQLLKICQIPGYFNTLEIWRSLHHNLSCWKILVLTIRSKRVCRCLYSRVKEGNASYLGCTSTEWKHPQASKNSYLDSSVLCRSETDGPNAQQSSFSTLLLCYINRSYLIMKATYGNHPGVQQSVMLDHTVGAACGEVMRPLQGARWTASPKCLSPWRVFAGEEDSIFEAMVVLLLTSVLCSAPGKTAHLLYFYL